MAGTKCPVMMCHILEDSEIPQREQDEEEKQYSSVLKIFYGN